MSDKYLSLLLLNKLSEENKVSRTQLEARKEAGTFNPHATDERPQLVQKNNFHVKNFILWKKITVSSCKQTGI